MVMRTVKGSVFTIIVDGKRIVIQHVSGKGKRCRISMPDGVRIEDQSWDADRSIEETTATADGTASAMIR